MTGTNNTVPNVMTNDPETNGIRRIVESDNVMRRNENVNTKNGNGIKRIKNTIIDVIAAIMIVIRMIGPIDPWILIVVVEHHRMIPLKRGGIAENEEKKEKKGTIEKRKKNGESIEEKEKIEEKHRRRSPSYENDSRSRSRSR